MHNLQGKNENQACSFPLVVYVSLLNLANPYAKYHILLLKCILSCNAHKCSIHNVDLKTG